MSKDTTWREQQVGIEKKQFVEELPRTIDRVESILVEPNTEELRDCDNLLAMHYYKRFHGLEDKIGKHDFKLLCETMKEASATPFEAITRARRRLQADGKCLGSREVQKERQAQGRQVREVLNG